MSRKEWKPGGSADQRIEEARSRLEMMADTSNRVIHLSANLALIGYEDTLEKKVKKSAHALPLSVIREAILNTIIIDLCALWDRAADNAANINSIAALIDNDEVRAKFPEGSVDAALSHARIPEALENALMGYRDEHLAHKLTAPSSRSKGEQLMYGHEEDGMKRTIAALDALSELLLQSSRRWEGVQIGAEEYAKTLWSDVRLG